MHPKLNKNVTVGKPNFSLLWGFWRTTTSFCCCDVTAVRGAEGGDDGVRRKLQSAAAFLRSLFGVFIRLVYHKSLSTPTPSGRAKYTRIDLWTVYLFPACINDGGACTSRRAEKYYTHARCSALLSVAAAHNNAFVWRVRVAPKHACSHTIKNTKTQI